MVPSNLSHNVPAAIKAAKNRLTDLAKLYLATEVAGQSQATLDAKRRDLLRFLAFYHQLYGHDRPDEWFVSVTKAFLKYLRGQRFAQASLVRIYATVRHFARWLDRKFPELFPLGCPTDGVKPPAEPTADWKGLTRTEELRLLNAAQTLRVKPGPGTKQGLRNHALLAVLLGSGLRISEVLQLDRDQCTDKGFVRVQVKGGQLRDIVPVQRDARAVLDQWLEQRGDAAGPLFPTRSRRRLSRREAAQIIQRLAGQANANRPKQEHIQVSPHVLRHTFLRKLAEGYSLRKLATVIGVSFSSLARMERGEGEPDNNSRVRILEWLGEDARALGLPLERITHLHFRASKNIDSKTIHCLLQVDDILKRKFGTRRMTASRPTNTPLPEVSPVILSKLDMEAMAQAFRKELGLKDQSRLDPLKIVIEGVKVLTVREIDGIPPEVKAHLEVPGCDAWSAISVLLDEENDTWVIIRNGHHQATRQNASLLEEFWHILLGHKLTKVAKVGNVYGRTFDENEEHDAFYLASATLLPENIIRKAVRAKEDMTKLANDHGTSLELVEYRIKRLGLWREYKGKSVWLETT